LYSAIRKATEALKLEFSSKRYFPELLELDFSRTDAFLITKPTKHRRVAGVHEYLHIWKLQDKTNLKRKTVLYFLAKCFQAILNC